MLAAHSKFLSDPALAIPRFDTRFHCGDRGPRYRHVSDHTSDHPHALIESVDRVAYYVPNDAAIAEARSNGKLTPNAFVQLRDISIAD